MGIDVSGLGAVADLAGKVIDRFFPDKTEQERAQLAAALTVIQGQLDTNKTEAAKLLGLSREGLRLALKKVK